MSAEVIIYLDHNATTPVRPEVLEAMLPFFDRCYGNSSSIHTLGRQARGALETAREKVAQAIGAEPAEIIFTGGGSEADNLAVKGLAWEKRARGNHIITTAIEHHAILHACEYLEKNGFEVTYLPVDGTGLVEVKELEKAIRKETILITVMMANNEVGTIEPIAEIGSLAREKGIVFHTDAIQALGKIPVEVRRLNVDLLALSAHKIYGPKGVGALYIRKGTRLHSLVHGGGHEGGKRAGTENIAGIVGFGRAAELAVRELGDYEKKIKPLRDKLEKLIEENISYTSFNGNHDSRLPNTLNLSFEFVEGEAIVLGLDIRRIAVSTGSACSSGTLEPSHVLKAMGVPLVLAQSAIRFSLGRENTGEEIEETVRVLREVVERLRRMSPFYDEKIEPEEVS